MTLENDTSIETMRVDLHCHSEASSDCWTPLEAFLTRCPQEGIAVQAITDHNEIWGAVKLQEMVAEKQETLEAPLTIIVGEEISSSQGEIIGLFLKEKIEPGLSPEETVQQIKDQDGLVLLPHGFDVLKRWRLKSAARRQIAEQIDIVEAFNARISLRYWNRRAASWAREREIHLSAGSDAHTPGHIGQAWIEVPAGPVDTPQHLLDLLPEAEPTGLWTHPIVAFGHKLWNRVRPG